MSLLTVMTIAVCVAGALAVLGYSKAAAGVMLGAVIACFGYRWLYLHVELQTVIADGWYCIALLPIGWWAAKSLEGTATPETQTGKCAI